MPYNSVTHHKTPPQVAPQRSRIVKMWLSVQAYLVRKAHAYLEPELTVVEGNVLWSLWVVPLEEQCCLDC